MKMFTVERVLCQHAQWKRGGHGLHGFGAIDRGGKWTISFATQSECCTQRRRPCHRGTLSPRIGACSIQHH